MGLPLAAPTIDLMSAAAIRRLTVSLILAEQADLVARGQMGREAMVTLRDSSRSPEEIDALTIDEEGLGFDSLSRLSLVLRLNRFFGLWATGIEDYLLLRRRLGDWVGLIEEHQRRMGADLVLTFDTSGSSGPVKHVPHPARALWAEVRAHLSGPLAALKNGSGRILSMVPPHHIYGCLFSILLPDLLGRETRALQHLSPTSVFRLALPGDLVVGTPFTWDMVARSGLRFAGGVCGLTSAGPATAATFAITQECNLFRMTEIYGATETGGLATRDAFGAPFALLPHLRRTGLSVSGPQGPLDLQDHLDWLSDRQFHLIGRKDDVVKIAGVNVSPAHVQSLLLTVEGVAEVAVRPGPERLRAFVVAAPQADLAALRARVGAFVISLPAPARPAPVTYGTALPRNPIGKLSDWSDD